MKQLNLTAFHLLFIALMLVGPVTTAQNSVAKSVKPITLKHWLTPEEAKLKETYQSATEETDPPPGPVTNIAEFNRMQSVLIRYSFGISYAVIAEMSQDCNVTTVVASTSEQTYVTNQYQNQGVNLANCDFIIAPSNSYWTRDYGPWFVIDGNDELGIVDFEYNRPRPADNAIPSKVAQEMDINLFVMDIETAGGNYMCDGMGIGSSSDLIWAENNSYTHAQIDQIFEDYLGIEEYHVLDDPNNTYIDHIDCWGKFLDVDKVLIRSVPTSHAQYDELEATAAYYAGQLSSYGTPFEVYRVYTPNDQPYTNSLILNEKVIVPIVNSQWDDEALAVYEEAMPGYTVVGYTGSWESTDALHCRAMGLADKGMLHINHVAVMGEQPVQADYTVEANIKTLSGEDVNTAIIYYRVNGAAWEMTNMTNTSGQIWTGEISGASAGSQVDYYLYVADQSGRNETHPFIGEPDPHVFFVGEQGFAHINVDPTGINVTADVGQSTVANFTISNLGQLELNYSIETNTATFEELDYSVEDSPPANSYDYNTYTKEGWTDLEVAESGEVAAFEISYTWDTDSWPLEGSLLVESPSGTKTTIASGYTDGTYTVDATAFNGEEIAGTWKIWIEDSYGDGGHQATDITVKITRVENEIAWLGPVDPSAGTVEPGGSIECMVPCSAAELEAGTYEGTIILTSNDPDYPMVEIPVTFYTGPTLIISEVADPSDNANARFVELYNSGNSVINLSSETWNISRQADGVAYTDAALTGTIAPKETYVISYSATSFNTAFGFDSDQNAGSVVTGSGNDGYFLYKGGDHTSGTLIDIYGVIDENGSGQPWEYTDSKAERKNTITTPSASWTASEWTITSAAVADMTPGEHNGNISWKGGTGNWNTAASWSNGSVPTDLDNVIVPDGATLTVDATDAAVNNINIQKGGAFSIDATQTLSVSGTITIEDGGSFINNGTLDNGAKADATAVMQRTIDAYTTNASGWHLLSSPVNNFTIAGSDFEPGTATPNLDDFYAWGEVTYEWLNYKVGTNNITNFVNGQGYLVAYETTATKDFTGTFNNSDITFTNLTKTPGKGEGLHLLGNPFQSALQWTNTGWAKANIAAGAKIMNPGGTYTDITVGGTDIIPANQGFFIQVTNSTNSITIPKAGRTHNSTAFYKSEIPSMLTLRAGDGDYYVDTWIQIMDDATDGFDEQYDVSFLGGVYQAPYLYSKISETEHFSTNRIAPVEDETIVQLAFKSFLNKEFTIKASNVGSFGDQLDVLLEDTQEDVLIDLNKTPEYSFIASADELTERFKVHLLKSTGISEGSQLEDFNIYSSGKTIYFNSKNAENAVVKIYNTTGQLIDSKQLNINGLTQVEVEAQTGWYVVKMLINENSFTKKVLLY